jgi:hypothetical protein
MKKQVLFVNEEQMKAYGRTAMKIRQILEEISKNYTVLKADIVKNTNIRRVKIEEPLKNTIDDDILLLTTNNEWEVERRAANVLCLTGKAPDPVSETSRNVIWILGDDSLIPEIRGDIQDVILGEQEQNDLYVRLLRAMISGNKIDEMLTLAADEERNALVAIDLSGKVLAHSTPFRVHDPVWTSSIPNGFCPPVFMQHIRKVRNETYKDKREQPFLRYCEAFRVYYLCSEIRIESLLYGYVFMIQEKAEFTPGCTDIVSFFSRVLARTISSDEKERLAIGRIRSNVIVDIIKGVRREEALSRISSSGLALPTVMTMIVIRPAYLAGSVYFDEAEMEELKQIVPGSIITLYGDSTVLIAGQEEGAEEKEERRMKLEMYCEAHHFQAGVSNEFLDPMEMKERYEQVYRMLQIVKSMDLGGCVFDYQDYFFYDLLSAYPRDRMLSAYCHPALRILKNRDREKSTHLYETLIAYVTHGFNMKETADALFIHRNTLSYRRQKIEELTGLNFDDPDTRFYLRCSCQIARYTERFL